MMYEEFAQLLLGKTKEEGEEMCIAESRRCRVVKEDGVLNIVTMDYCPTRINIALTQGIIVSTNLG